MIVRGECSLRFDAPKSRIAFPLSHASSIVPGQKLVAGCMTHNRHMAFLPAG